MIEEYKKYMQDFIDMDLVTNKETINTEDFSEGLIKVSKKTNGKTITVFLDTKYNPFLSVDKYDEVYDFKNGLAKVGIKSKDGIMKYTYINKQGEEINENNETEVSTKKLQTKINNRKYETITIILNRLKPQIKSNTYSKISENKYEYTEKDNKYVLLGKPLYDYDTFLICKDTNNNYFKYDKESSLSVYFKGKSLSCTNNLIVLEDDTTYIIIKSNLINIGNYNNYKNYDIKVRKSTKSLLSYNDFCKKYGYDIDETCIKNIDELDIIKTENKLELNRKLREKEKRENDINKLVMTIKEYEELKGENFTKEELDSINIRETLLAE